MTTFYTMVTKSTTQDKAFSLSLTTDLGLSPSSYYGLKTGSYSVIFRESATASGVNLSYATNPIGVQTDRFADMETGSGTLDIDLYAINRLIREIDSAFTTLKAGQSIDIPLTVLYLGANSTVLSESFLVSIKSGFPDCSAPTMTLATEGSSGSATVTVKNAFGNHMDAADYLAKVTGTTVPLQPVVTFAYTGGSPITDSTLYASLLAGAAATLSGSAFVFTNNTLAFTPGTRFLFLPYGVTAEFPVPISVTDRTTLLLTTLTMTVRVNGANSSVTKVTASLTGTTATTTTTGLTKTVFTPTYAITDSDVRDIYTYSITSFTAKNKESVLLPNQNSTTYLTADSADGKLTLNPDAFKNLEADESVILTFKVTVHDAANTSSASGFLTITVSSGTDEPESELSLHPSVAAGVEKTFGPSTGRQRMAIHSLDIAAAEERRIS